MTYCISNRQKRYNLQIVSDFSMKKRAAASSKAIVHLPARYRVDKPNKFKNGILSKELRKFNIKVEWSNYILNEVEICTNYKFTKLQTFNPTTSLTKSPNNFFSIASLRSQKQSIFLNMGLRTKAV